MSDVEIISPRIEGQSEDRDGKPGNGTGTERRAAAEAYDKLAAEFQERQKGVESIMGKVCLCVIMIVGNAG